MSDIALILNRYVKLVDEQMGQVLMNRGEVDFLYNMMRYHLGWLDEHFVECNISRGKGIRPALCLLACEAISGNSEKALPAAAALELIHNFTLVHDDIEDGDELRRHRYTLWKLWGIPQAINTGDTMETLAYKSLMDSEVEPDRMIRMLKLLNANKIELCEGQFLDIDFPRRDQITVNDYLTMVSGKTASLLEAYTGIGAMIATGDEEIIRRFKTFGRKIGMGFQIKDDILGIWGDSADTGKSTINDIYNKKKSLPVLYAMANSIAGEELKNIYLKKQISEADVSRVVTILNNSGAREYSWNTCLGLYHDALAQLDGIDLCKGPTEDLRALAKFFVERTF
jgi:geranylgeranyl diphosphate synthase, type I